MGLSIIPLHNTSYFILPLFSSRKICHARAGRLVPGGVELEYASGTGSILVEHAGNEAVLTLSADPPGGSQDIQCRLPVRLVPGQVLRAGGGRTLATDGQRVRVSGREAGWIGGSGWRIDLPQDATFEYPVSPFNPYAKDGAAPLDQAVGFIHAPLRPTAAGADVPHPGGKGLAVHDDPIGHNGAGQIGNGNTICQERRCRCLDPTERVSSNR